MWRLKPTVLLAAAWALVSVISVKSQLRRGRARPTVLRPPPLPRRAGVGMDGVLKRLPSTCLESALVRQAWLIAQQEPRDVVIGVPRSGLTREPAHAWLDGLDQTSPRVFLELHRIAPESGRSNDSAGRT
jgi:Transglutaminase-like superfamily